MALNDSGLLAINPGFQRRVQAAVSAACVAIAAEGTAVVNHPPRLQLVHSILSNTVQLTSYTTLFSSTISTDALVVSDATANGTVALTTANVDAQQALITDAHITAAASGQFNAFCQGIPA